MKTMTIGYASIHACGVYVLLQDHCSMIAIIGEVLERKPVVHNIELAIIPKDDKKFLEMIDEEFDLISQNEFEIEFMHRGERITLTKVKKESWSSFVERKAA